MAEEARSLEDLKSALKDAGSDIAMIFVNYITSFLFVSS